MTTTDLLRSGPIRRWSHAAFWAGRRDAPGLLPRAGWPLPRAVAGPARRGALRAHDPRPLGPCGGGRGRSPPLARPWPLAGDRRRSRPSPRPGRPAAAAAGIPAPWRARACTRSRSARCMPASSSPGISASMSRARRWRGWRNGWATRTRAYRADARQAAARGAAKFAARLSGDSTVAHAWAFAHGRRAGAGGAAAAARRGAARR